jgi:hypothetical protein
MNRRDWMAVRAYLPSFVALVAAFALIWIVEGLQQSPLWAGIFAIARWSPLVFAVIAVIHGAWTTYRLWLADRGEGLVCSCGGLLGHERDGRFGFYRRCMCCGRNVGQRHYQ